MADVISTELLARIVAEANATPDVEVCGLLLGRGKAPMTPIATSAPFVLSLSKPVLSFAEGDMPQANRPQQVLRQAQHEREGGGAAHPLVTEIRPCRNVAADPSRTFEIDPAALIAAHRAARAGGPAILGCYHSHPSGSAIPSANDAADAMEQGWLWIIAANDDVRVWRVVEGGPVLDRFVEVCAPPYETRRALG